MEYARKGGTPPFMRIFFHYYYFFHEEVLLIFIIYEHKTTYQVNLDLYMKSRHYRHHYTCSSICESYSTNEKIKALDVECISCWKQ